MLSSFQQDDTNDSYYLDFLFRKESLNTVYKTWNYYTDYSLPEDKRSVTGSLMRYALKKSGFMDDELAGFGSSEEFERTKKILKQYSQEIAISFQNMEDKLREQAELRIAAINRVASRLMKEYDNFPVRLPSKTAPPSSLQIEVDPYAEKLKKILNDTDFLLENFKNYLVPTFQEGLTKCRGERKEKE